MSWLTDLFSSGIEKVVGAVGSVIDSLSTTDEEKLKLSNALQKEMNEFKRFQLDSIAAYDKEITERHRIDMGSDSWLSKNIRPLLLAFLTVMTVILAYTTIFTLEPEDLALIEPWRGLLETLLMTAFMFYFGSRGAEKIQKIKSESKDADK